MRIILALLLVATAINALETSKFAILLQAGTRENDAVESVYNLLRDLKTENVQVQAAADQKNQTDEETGGYVISRFTEVANINKQNWLSAQAHTKDLQTQLKDTYAWLAWADARLAEIERKAEELQDQRCFANGLFVRSLKDHSDAVEVVRLLKQDVSGYLTGKASSLAQVTPTSVADRLSMYSHLFQKDAMNQFMQLASQEKTTQSDTIADQVYDLLSEIESKLDETLAYLQEQEIKAAFALAKWLSDVGAEKAHLNQEIQRKQTALEKLTVAEPAALATQAKANAMVKESLDALKGSQEDLEEKRAEYAQGSARRAEENAIIDMCVSIFKEQVRNLVSQTSLKKI